MEQPTETTRWASHTIRKTLGLAAWTAAWVLTLAFAAFGPELVWNHQVAPTVAAIVLNLLVGIGMLWANLRYLQSVDELQRAIQLQAMAWSLGAGLVGGMGWTLFSRLDLVTFDAGFAQLVIFMSVVYLVAYIGGSLRYR